MVHCTPHQSSSREVGTPFEKISLTMDNLARVISSLLHREHPPGPRHSEEMSLSPRRKGLFHTFRCHSIQQWPMTTSDLDNTVISINLKAASQHEPVSGRAWKQGRQALSDLSEEQKGHVRVSSTFQNILMPRTCPLISILRQHTHARVDFTVLFRFLGGARRLEVACAGFNTVALGATSWLLHLPAASPWVNHPTS